MKSLLIQEGQLIDPIKGIYTADILVKQGKIAAIEPNIELQIGVPVAPEVIILSAKGKLVTPGLIDLHVHLREPGFEYKETVASGSRAAARGGFTSIVCMPNTKPAADSGPVIDYILNKAKKAGLVNVYPVGAITKGLNGDELAEMFELKAAGAVAVSDDGRPVANAELMRRALQYAGMLGLPVISHCEEEVLSCGGVVNEGFISTVLGLKGIPAAAEEIMVARDLILSELTGCPLHIAHVSTGGSVRLIREAKDRRVPVTAEVTPHHFTLTEEVVAGYDTNTKVNPPLRKTQDIAALKEGLADGTIDVIATDHAPHSQEEKEVEYQNAPFGIIGLETAVGLIWTELVHAGVLTPLQAITKLTLNPARILGIPKGTLAVGGDADITIIDPNWKETVRVDQLAGKARNTPFAGRCLRGLPVATIVGGRIIMKDRVVGGVKKVAGNTGFRRWY